MLSSFKLSWRRTVAFLKLSLFIAKSGSLEKLKKCDRLRFRWCFSLMINQSGIKNYCFFGKCYEKSCWVFYGEAKIYYFQEHEYHVFLYFSATHSLKSSPSVIYILSHCFLVDFVKTSKAFSAVLPCPSSLFQYLDWICSNLCKCFFWNDLIEYDRGNIYWVGWNWVCLS